MFQGNIIEYGKSEAQTGSIYKLSGKIINPVEQFDEEKMINENDLFQLQTNWLPIMEGENEDSSSDFDSQTRCISNRHLSKLSKSDGESSSNSPESSLPLSSQGSGSGYLDSDLVKAAIERLNFDDSEVTIVLPSQKIHNIRVIKVYLLQPVMITLFAYFRHRQMLPPDLHHFQ